MLGALLVRLTSGPNLEGAYTEGELDCPPEPLYDDRPLLQLPTFCVSLLQADYSCGPVPYVLWHRQCVHCYSGEQLPAGMYQRVVSACLGAEIDSSIGIATSYRLDGSVFESRHTEIFLFSKTVQANAASYSVVTGDSLPQG